MTTEHGENLRLRDTYVNSLAKSLSRGSELAYVPELLRTVIAEQMWKERFVSQTKQVITFKSFRDFVEADPPEGLKANVNLLIKICESYNDMEAVSLIATEIGGKPGNPTGNNQYSGIDNNIINSTMGNERKSPTGTSTAATMRRLAKQYPDLHAKVLTGEMRPSAAAVEAGFQKRNFQMPTDPSAAGRYLAQRVDQDWLMECVDAFMKAIQ